MTDWQERDNDHKKRAELVGELASLRQKVAKHKRTERALQSYKSMVTASNDLMVFVDSTGFYPVFTDG